MLQNIVNKNTLTQNNIIKKQKTHTRAHKKKFTTKENFKQRKRMKKPTSK